MQFYPQKFKYWFKNGAYLGLAMLFVSLGLGCAGTHKTTTTETTVTTYPAADQGQKPHNNRGYIIQNQDQTVVERSETTTTTTESKAGHPGIISSTVHAIGWVIALPFTIIGGLLRWIF